MFKVDKPARITELALNGAALSLNIRGSWLK